MSAGLYNTTYAIPRASNIPSDSTEHKVSTLVGEGTAAMVPLLPPQVTVAIIDLKPELSYVAVPRLSPYCFLRAKVQNSSPYAMLAGPANIFLGTNFVAKVMMTFGVTSLWLTNHSYCSPSCWMCLQWKT